METKGVTFEEIGIKAGLDGVELQRYIRYMKARWADDEGMKCVTGYAMEWANRFLHGDEYTMSDGAGRMVLDIIDRKDGGNGEYRRADEY